MIHAVFYWYRFWLVIVKFLMYAIVSINSFSTLNDIVGFRFFYRANYKITYFKIQTICKYNDTDFDSMIYNDENIPIPSWAEISFSWLTTNQTSFRHWYLQIKPILICSILSRYGSFQVLVCYYMIFFQNVGLSILSAWRIEYSFINSPDQINVFVLCFPF